MVLGLKRKPFQRQSTNNSELPLSELRVSPKGVDNKGSDELGGSSSTIEAPVALQAQKEAEFLQKTHAWDPNLPEDLRENIDGALKDHDIDKELAIERELAADSPYPEVRSAVRNYDEDVPANTIRAWVLGMFFVTVLSAVNMLFSMRNPPVFIGALVVQLIVYPIGVFWAKVMPTRQYTTFGIRWTLNTGPFNVKEHTLIIIMANATFAGGALYSTDVLLAQIVQYKQNFGWGFQILLATSSQMIGYGLAGMGRRFLVWPAAMIWPSNLVNCALFYALHQHSPADPATTNGWSIGRYKWFLWVCTASFCWYWIPGFLAQFMSAFAFVTWIKPNNVLINQLFGAYTGMSLLPMTFDWNIVTAFLSSPLPSPWHAVMNTTVATVFFFMIVTPAVHYSGLWFSDFLPLSDNSVHDNTGATYNVTRILNAEGTFDLAAYKAYSPLFLSTTFAISYGISFAAVLSIVVHVALYHGQDLWLRLRMARSQEDDVHMRLMKKYRDAPDWWYLSLLVSMIALGFATCAAYDTKLTWWAFAIAMGIAIVWTIPIGVVSAITNVTLGLNVITEFIIGYMQPGRPLAMMMFKTYGYITMFQALTFLSDLKLGHYMKIPPRSLFFAQVIASLWGNVVQIATMNWALGNISNACTVEASNKFTCPGARTFYNASVIWGVIGPGKVFSHGAIYGNLEWFFLVGAGLPVILFFLSRRFPKTPVRYLMAPLIFGSVGDIPPATPLNYLSWCGVGWFFCFYLRRKYFGWWKEYNYITSAGLDSGLAIAAIIIFFAFSLSGTEAPNWWGNNAIFDTLDANNLAVKIVLPPGETFGPPPGSW